MTKTFHDRPRLCLPALVAGWSLIVLWTIPAAGQQSQTPLLPPVLGVDPADLPGTDAATPPATAEVDPAANRGDFFRAATGAYKQSLIENNFSYLNDPTYEGWHLGESIKQLSLGQHWGIDLGGDYRLRYHDERNLRSRPISGRDDTFTLQRTRLYADASWGQDIRFFVQAIDATSGGATFRSRSSEVNRFDATNLFVELCLYQEEQAQWSVRGGRQEILLGSQRLLTNSPWRNVSVSHDGLRTWFKNGVYRTDAFWVRPIDFGQHLPQDRNFDSPDQSQNLYGIFTRYDAPGDNEFNVYWIARDETDDRFNNSAGAAGTLDAHSLGFRLLHTGERWLGELETVLQLGRAGDETIKAGFATGGVGRVWTGESWTSSVWVYYDWASGDRSPGDDTYGTAVRYFPRGHYYLGYADIVGRQNIHDVNVQWRVSPNGRLQFIVAAHAYDLDSASDALYNTGGTAIHRDPTGQSGTDIGHEIDVFTRWRITPRHAMAVGYSRFFTGDYFDSPVIRGPATAAPGNGSNGRDAEFIYGTWVTRF